MYEVDVKMCCVGGWCDIEEEEANMVVRKVVGAAVVDYGERSYAFRFGWCGGCGVVGARAMSVATGLVDLTAQYGGRGRVEEGNGWT